MATRLATGSCSHVRHPGLQHAAFSTTPASSAGIRYAIHRNYEAEELLKPRVKGPTSRERRLLPPAVKKERLKSILGGRVSQKFFDPRLFPPLEGGTASALRLLRSQPSIYAKCYLESHPYIVTSGDLITTHHLSDTKPGDVVRFTRVVEVGSRDYTLRTHRPLPGEDMEDSTYLAPDTVSVLGVVLEHTRSNVRYTFRRGSHYKHLRGHVNGYTRIRIGEIKLGIPRNDGATYGWTHNERVASKTSMA